MQNEPGIVINTSQGILNSSDKGTMKQMLIDNNVPIPKIYLTADEAFENLPLLARPRYYSKGRNSITLMVRQDLSEFIHHHRNDRIRLNGWTVQKLLTNVLEEYRIFVFNDKIFETNIKRPEGSNPHPIIRNFDHGWTIKPIARHLVPRGVQSRAKDATRAMGLIFSAVDMCYTRDGKIYVYEVNSAPGLFERKVDKLAEHIHTYVEDAIE